MNDPVAGAVRGIMFLSLLRFSLLEWQSRQGRFPVDGRCFWIFPSLCLLSGCSLNVVPSFPIFGAYFPAWMICALAGVFAAVGARVFCVYVGVDSFLSFRLFTYVSLGVLAALAVRLLVFGP